MTFSFTDQHGERQQCMRCGTCCKKGGPALHEQDIALVSQKIIAPENLYTIRVGELVRDNVNGGLIYTDVEIIKIRASEASHACVFFRNNDNTCGIYEDRPDQCHVLECWNSEKIRTTHMQNRLDRKMLFGGLDWLWNMLEDHESKCNYLKIQKLIERRRAGDSSVSRELEEMISYDQAIRDFVIEKANKESGMLNLLFGMPLKLVLRRRFGLKIQAHV